MYIHAGKMTETYCLYRDACTPERPLYAMGFFILSEKLTRRSGHKEVQFSLKQPKQEGVAVLPGCLKTPSKAALLVLDTFNDFKTFPTYNDEIFARGVVIVGFLLSSTRRP